MKQNHRRMIVLSSLVCVLTLTSALLLALEPAPLTPDVSGLLAVDAPQGMDVIFQTDAPSRPGQWKYIYVHHSKSAGGNGSSLAQASRMNNGAAGTGEMDDHFVIGNGNGADDGEIQIGPRWSRQSPAAAPVGTAFDREAANGIISICVVGDFDRSVPTPVQLRRLQQLVGTLQGRLRISADHVIERSDVTGPPGCGRYFPMAAFRDQLLP